jgi:hypothetical protein
MNKPVPEHQVKAGQRLGFVDCDIHPVQRSPKDLFPYLSAQWREHAETFGPHICQGLSSQLPFPRMMASGMRADAYPSNGGPPGCDIELMQRQHLDLQRLRHRDADLFVARRHGRAQSGIRRGAVARGQ